MTAYKVFIILFVLILIALNTGRAAALPIVDPVRQRCPSRHPHDIYYIDSSTAAYQQPGREAWPYRDPYCKILPPGPILWA